ncbi:hypothetical protein HYW76_04555 [Candidatus Pacearchaeota archaeon]|nr:hypothetical protein [Candidatus Pacearchaeota archaeon]
MKKNDIILGIGICAFILFVVFLSLLLADKFHSQSCGCPNVIEKNFIYIFVILAVIFVGSLSYYLFKLRLETQDSLIKKNLLLVLSFLDEDEKNVIKEIAANNGIMTQTNITSKYGKLKSHRIIRKLEKKGLIIVNPIGKTNEIKLKEELKQELA